MTQDELVEKSMEYFNSIAHTIGDRLTIADAMILVTRAYEVAWCEGREAHDFKMKGSGTTTLSKIYVESK